MSSAELRRIAVKDGLVQIVAFGVGFTLMFRFSDNDSWPRAVVWGAIAGAGLGLINTYFSRRQRRQRHALLADLSDDERKQVVRATKRRYVPADGRLRERATQLGAQIHADLTRHRAPVAVFVAGLLTVALISAVVDGGWWWWLGTAVFAATLAQMYVLPARLEHRLKSLAE